jgi:hypothetical protein
MWHRGRYNEATQLSDGTNQEPTGAPATRDAGEPLLGQVDCGVTWNLLTRGGTYKR